ncbi:MAG: PqqD family protein [Clostridia bacterium]|nr:PqqD family protein [Clostridia bacterium]
MKLKIKFVINEMSGNYIAVPVDDNKNSFSGFLKLNETAAFIIEQLGNGCTSDELINSCVAKFDCTTQEAKESAEAIIEKLKTADLLEE